MRWPPPNPEWTADTQRAYRRMIMATRRAAVDSNVTVENLIRAVANAVLKDQADYDALFAEYERTSLPGHGDALATIRGWVDAGARVALTCYERSPQQCHRHCVSEALEREFGKRLAARHI